MSREERRTVVEVIKGSPYKRPAELAEDLQLSKKTILSRKDELQQEDERYGYTAVIEDEKTILINVYAFLDFMKHRARLKDKNMRKYVPPYDPQKWADACAYGTKVYMESLEAM